MSSYRYISPIDVDFWIVDFACFSFMLVEKPILHILLLLQVFISPTNIASIKLVMRCSKVNDMKNP